MGAASSVELGVQNWQMSQDYPTHPFANDETRRALKDRLKGNASAEDLLGASQVNPAIRAAVVEIIGGNNAGGEHNVGAEDDLDTVGCAAEVALHKRYMAVELILGTLQRLNNRSIYNLFIVYMTMLALAHHIPQVYWSILTSLGVLFSKRWATDLAKELGDEVYETDPPGASTNVAMVVFDNKCYMMKQTFVHAQYNDEGHDQPRTNGEMLYTNNVLWSPIMLESELTIERG